VWDEHLPGIALGYNASVQESTKMSPIYLLFGRHPSLPASQADLFRRPLGVAMDPAEGEEAQAPPSLEAQAADLLTRAKAMDSLTAQVGSNLRIAQHRDTLRYARTRSGAFMPTIKKFAVGDYVYLRESKSNDRNLSIDAQPSVRRVRAVNKSGVLRLVDPTGQVSTHNVTQCAPCHAPPPEQQVDFTLLRPSTDHPCQKCSFGDNDGVLLLCDSCPHAWHTYCLPQPLEKVPPAAWQCPACVAAKVPLPPERQAGPQYGLTSAAKARMSTHGKLTGRYIHKRFGDTYWWGVVHYLGPWTGKCFRIMYSDGSMEDLSYRQLRPWLKDESVSWPRDVTEAPPLELTAEEEEARKEVGPRALLVHHQQIHSNWGAYTRFFGMEPGPHWQHMGINTQQRRSVAGYLVAGTPSPNADHYLLVDFWNGVAVEEDGIWDLRNEDLPSRIHMLRREGISCIAVIQWRPELQGQVEFL
jgi:hypothetical protein